MSKNESKEAALGAERSDADPETKDGSPARTGNRSLRPSF